jgi:hypothetical protein
MTIKVNGIKHELKEQRGLFAINRIAQLMMSDRPCPPAEYKYLMSKQIGVCPYNISEN